MNKNEEELKKSMDMLQLRNEQLDCENLALHDKIAVLETQLGLQQPEVPPFVADWLALIEENTYMITHEQAIEHKEAIAWLEEHQSELMLLKCLLICYTVEKPKIIVSPCPVCRFEDVKANFCGICGHKNEYVEVVEEKRFYLKNKLTKKFLAVRTGHEVERVKVGDYQEVRNLPLKNEGVFKVAFTQSEIDSMAAESYEQIEVQE